MFKQSSSPLGGRCSLCNAFDDGKQRFMKLYKLLGFRFVCVTVMIELVLQAFVAGGGSGGLVGAPILLLLSTFKLPATRMQILETVATAPWQLKPLMGILSDSLYIGGYNKMPYIIITSLAGIISAVIIATFYPISPLLFTSLLFFIFLQIATGDLLLEARYVEKTKRSPASRPTLYAFIRFCSGFCQLASIGLVGLLISYHAPLQWLYLSPVLPFLVVAMMVYGNWAGEKLYDQARPLTNLLCQPCWFTEQVTQDKEEAGPHTIQMPVIGADTTKVKENWRIFLLALIIGAISIFTSVLGLFEMSTTYLFVASVLSAFIMIGCFFLLLERNVAKVLAFIVIQNMFSISLRAATFFFYTDPAEAYPAGPHFSRQFYVTVMGGVGILFSVLGVFIYGAFMHEWTYRRIFMVTSVLYIITCVPNILLFKRINVAWGIPDGLFILGSEVVQVVVGELNSMPFGVIMLSLCSPGMEASLYAIMAGSSNLGGAFASYQGAFVLEMLGVRPSGNMTGESAQFDNLWIASLISLSIQVVPLFFIHLLIPDAKQTQDLLLMDNVTVEYLSPTVTLIDDEYSGDKTINAI